MRTLEMLASKNIFVILALTVKLCQSEEVEAPDQRMQARFLGTLNRYYVSSWAAVSTGIEYVQLENSDAAVNAITLLDGNQQVAIVVHGRSSSAFSEFAHSLRSSFINDQQTVVIVVDWSVIANMDYATALNAVPFVADDLVTLMVRMDTLGKINRNLVHIVGFDVGAHIAGIVSRDSRARVQKITALSPAGQNWDVFSRRLRATDAVFVEVVHTDFSGTRALGINEPIGTVDLFVNGGTSQPGCFNNQCNHDRAWNLFVATLDTGGHLVGLRCENMTDMSRNRCVGIPAVTLGTNALVKTGAGTYRVNIAELILNL
ncbi:lipase member I-like [Choristoneura fumiferana]|uniref:lipase member I-like n=1 Tax=Choristoneura fumiferana TaxID=7141 RepID=UPI003D156F21